MAPGRIELTFPIPNQVFVRAIWYGSGIENTSKKLGDFLTFGGINPSDITIQNEQLACSSVSRALLLGEPSSGEWKSERWFASTSSFLLDL